MLSHEQLLLLNESLSWYILQTENTRQEKLLQKLRDVKFQLTKEIMEAKNE